MNVVGAKPRLPRRFGVMPGTCQVAPAGLGFSRGDRTGFRSTRRHRGRDGGMNLALWVERQGRLRPDGPALAEGERVHATWATFAARTAAAASSLRDDFGLSPGDR